MSDYACGFLEGIEYLLDVGAKVDLKNKKGESCLAWLRKHLEDAIAGVRSRTKAPLQPLSQLPRKKTENVKEMDEGYDWLVDVMGEKKKRKRPIGENIFSEILKLCPN